MAVKNALASGYRGRLAPSPTGRLHLGHARTFWLAAERARRVGGTLFLRNDDLDRDRCRPEFVAGFVEDLRWLGLTWTEPMITQSERLPLYRQALSRLHAAGCIYPCARSRREVAEAAAVSPGSEEADDEPLFPAAWRWPATKIVPPLPSPADPITSNWRFRVPDGARITFVDAVAGPQAAIAGIDFGDFLVWRKEDTPSYQLACAVDDGLLGITEVVRGRDLIASTFRQVLLLRALDYDAPDYAHAPLVCDEGGRRLAKRYDSLSLHTMRAAGRDPAELVAGFAAQQPFSP